MLRTVCHPFSKRRRTDFAEATSPKTTALLLLSASPICPNLRPILRAIKTKVSTPGGKPSNLIPAFIDPESRGAEPKPWATSGRKPWLVAKRPRRYIDKLKAKGDASLCPRLSSPGQFPAICLPSSFMSLIFFGRPAGLISPKESSLASGKGHPSHERSMLAQAGMHAGMTCKNPTCYASPPVLYRNCTRI